MSNWKGGHEYDNLSGHFFFAKRQKVEGLHDNKTKLPEKQKLIDTKIMCLQKINASLSMCQNNPILHNIGITANTKTVDLGPT